MAVIKYITPTQPASSTNGNTFYKNGGQLCMRSRAYPLPNQSQAHIVPMNAIAILSMLWESPLTNADRIAWGNYAFATPLTDAYGNPRFVKGYAHFMRVNRPLLQHGLPLQLLPPATTGLPTFTAASLATISGTTTVKVTITNTDPWANQTGAHMMLWISRQRSPRRLYPPEVYKPLGTVPGNGTTPPTNDQTFVNPWGFVKDTASQWLRGSVIDINGRLSNHTTGTNTNPKRQGTVTIPPDPCGGTTPIPFTPLAFSWTVDKNGIPVPNAQPNAMPFTGTHTTGWAYSMPQGFFTFVFQWVPTCPHVPNPLPASIFLHFAGGASDQYTCPNSNAGVGVYTAVSALSRPTTITLT